MDTTKPVKQLEIIKIALLIAVLVTLPLTISLFRTTGFNKEIFSSELFVDLDLKFWFFFLFLGQRCNSIPIGFIVFPKGKA